MHASVWAGLWPRLRDLLLPPHCLACGESVASGRDLCPGCADTLPHLGMACRRCAIPLPAGVQSGCCGRCLRRPPPYASCRALFRYADPIDRWLGALKFHADLAVTRPLGAALAQACLDPGAPAFDLLLPMPLHRRRLRDRGYNQVQELLRGLPATLAQRLQAQALQRPGETTAQSGLGAGARRRNLRGAFSADACVRGQRVLLVDDVITTGSTVAEASRCLLRAGAAEVHVLAVARVPKRYGAGASA